MGLEEAVFEDLIIFLSYFTLLSAASQEIPPNHSLKKLKTLLLNSSSVLCYSPSFIFSGSWSSQFHGHGSQGCHLIIIALISSSLFVNNRSSCVLLLAGSGNTYLKKLLLSHSRHHRDLLATPLWNTDNTYAHPRNHTAVMHLSLLSLPYQPGQQIHQKLFCFQRSNIDFQ